MWFHFSEDPFKSRVAFIKLINAGVEGFPSACVVKGGAR